eukprot:g5743.t1
MRSWQLFHPYPFRAPMSTESPEKVTGEKRKREEDGAEDVEEIKALVQAREDARKDKDYSKADEIRDKLKSLGVSLYDKEKVWKTANGEVGIIPAWDVEHKKSSEVPTAAGGALNTKAINFLVQAREVARKQKDWGKADKIREQLRSHGVSIYDKDGMWKASDGRTQLIQGAGKGGIGLSAVLNNSGDSPAAGLGLGAGAGMGMGLGAGAGMGMGMGAGLLGGINPQQQALLYAAALAQQQQHHQPAPPVSFQQPQAYGSQGAYGAPSGGMGYGSYSEHTEPANAYAMPHAPQAYGAPAASPASAIPSIPASYGNTATKAIDDLVAQREHARAKRDFSTADLLRDRIKALGVEIHDKEKRWTQPSTGLSERLVHECW